VFELKILVTDTEDPWLVLVNDAIDALFDWAIDLLVSRLYDVVDVHGFHVFGRVVVEVCGALIDVVVAGTVVVKLQLKKYVVANEITVPELDKELEADNNELELARRELMELLVLELELEDEERLVLDVEPQLLDKLELVVL
jgi:selenophosphate synthase